MEEQIMEFAVVEPVEGTTEVSEGFEEVKASQPKKRRPKTKVCPVVNYVAAYGIVGFYFDDIPCQIMVEPNTEIGKTITIKYEGDPKTGIHFWL